MPTRFFDLFEIPNIPGFSEAQGDIMKWLHLGAAWALAALVLIHVGAALKHHFLDRDDVLMRMLPGLMSAALSWDKPRSANLEKFGPNHERFRHGPAKAARAVERANVSACGNEPRHMSAKSVETLAHLPHFISGPQDGSEA